MSPERSRGHDDDAADSVVVVCHGCGRDCGCGSHPDIHERSSGSVGWLGGLCGKQAAVFEVGRHALKSNLGIHSREVGEGDRTGCQKWVGRKPWSGLDRIRAKGGGIV